MKIDIADRWIAALRSGEYEQGRGTLFHTQGYCCLGVLARVLGFRPDDNFKIDGQESYLSDNIRSMAGMRDTCGNYELPIDDKRFRASRELAQDNDDGLTFNQIADIIEYFKEDL